MPKCTGKYSKFKFIKINNVETSRYLSYRFINCEPYSLSIHIGIGNICVYLTHVDVDITFYHFPEKQSRVNSKYDILSIIKMPSNLKQCLLEKGYFPT